MSDILAQLVHAAVSTRLLQSLRGCATSSSSDKASAQMVRRIVGAEMSLRDQANALRRQARADDASLCDRSECCAAGNARCRQPFLERPHGTQIVPPTRYADL